MDTLTSLKIKGHIQKNKKAKSSIDALEVLFTGARIERGQCMIFFNERIDWSFMAQYFTILPRYYFQISNRSSDLLYYIFYLARQHAKDIEKQGYFNIGFRAIQHRLQLPSEIENREPSKTIRQPIEDAIEEIEEQHSNYYNNTDFSLLPIYDESDSITNFLDNGYLKVMLTGDFAKMFIEISKNTTKQIDTFQKRKSRIIEKNSPSYITKNPEEEIPPKKTTK